MNYTAGGSETYTILAGQYMNVGIVTIAPEGGGMVTISIHLTGGTIFYYDVADQYHDNNIKIQDYEDPPHGNPKVGKFDYKACVGPTGTSYTMIVPQNNYYGIHLDVAVPL